jgi:nitrile hydratase beta subunit
MNGIHDMGGMDGFGPVKREQSEPVFHAEWEKRLFGLVSAMIASRPYNIDEFRHAIERIPAPRYLASTYYERWLDAFLTLLVEKGIVSTGDLEAKGIEPPAPVQPPQWLGRAAAAKGRPTRARFSVGDRVIALNVSPTGHTRLPRYIRGKAGIVRRDWGVFVYPDHNAHGTDSRRHVYSVAFKARELWGTDAPVRDLLYIDLWEDYLEPAAVGSKRSVKTKAPRTMKRR